MPQLQSLNKGNLGTIRAAINEKLAPLLTELGLSKCQVGNIKFSIDGGTFAVELQIDQENSPVVRDYNLRTSITYGFPTNVVGMKFKHKGNEYKITGFNISSNKFPIECVDVKTNVSIYFPAQSVNRLINLA